MNDTEILKIFMNVHFIAEKNVLKTHQIRAVHWKRTSVNAIKTGSYYKKLALPNWIKLFVHSVESLVVCHVKWLGNPNYRFWANLTWAMCVFSQHNLKNGVICYIHLYWFYHQMSLYFIQVIMVLININYEHSNNINDFTVTCLEHILFQIFTNLLTRLSLLYKFMSCSMDAKKVLFRANGSSNCHQIVKSIPILRKVSSWPISVSVLCKNRFTNYILFQIKYLDRYNCYQPVSM